MVDAEGFGKLQATVVTVILPQIVVIAELENVFKQFNICDITVNDKSKSVWPSLM